VSLAFAYARELLREYVLEPMEPRRDNDLKEAPPPANDEKFEDHPMWLRVQDMLVRALQPFRGSTHGGFARAG
jgi:hypothetical protein